MYSKSDNLEIMINNKASEFIEGLFQSLLSRCQIKLETSMKGSHFIYYKCNKVNFKQGGSYIDSPDWMKNKKSTINPVNKKLSALLRGITPAHR